MQKLIGNAVVGQSGGPTAAINATLSGVIRGAKSAEEIGTIYGMRYGVEGLLSEDIFPLNDYFTQEKEHVLLENTPASALGSCRFRLPKHEDDTALYDKLLAIFKKYDIRYFFYIGGNDSMDTVAKLTAYLQTVSYEMRVIGVPKTIDNDLILTDHTPGFGSAAKFIATTIREIARDIAVYRIPAVTIVEVMGRDAGWLTASAALSSLGGDVSPDLIYLPECDFTMEAFFSDIRKALKKHPCVLVAVSEGIRFADGRYVGEGTQSGSVDTFGHKYLAGTGKALEHAVKAEIGCKVRSIELNLSQRCASHMASATDLEESVAIGKHAVYIAQEGKTGEMVAIIREDKTPYSTLLSSVSVTKVANQIKKMPSEFIVPAGNDVTPACVAYLAPLIVGERETLFANGLPKHFVFPSQK